MTPLQKLPKNVGDLGKLIVAKGFKKLPKVQQITQSGHTACHTHFPREKQRFSGTGLRGKVLRLRLQQWKRVGSGRGQCDQIGQFIGLWATF